MHSQAPVAVATYAGGSPTVTALVDYIVADVLAGRTPMRDGRPELEMNLAEVRELEGAGYLTGYSVPNPDGLRGVHWTAEGRQALIDAVRAARTGATA